MKAFPSKKPVIKHLGKFGPIEFKPIIEDGMDLRDYFAAKAMPIVVSIWNDVIKNNPDQDWGSPTIETSDFELIANDCYEMANAMMEARKI